MKKITKKKSFKKVILVPLLLLGLVTTITLAQQKQSLNQYASADSTCTETLSTTDQQKIDSVVQGVMTKYSVPGTSLAVTKDGRLVYVKGYGVSNKSTKEAVTNSTRFRIASISKPITATGVMLLVQSGRLSLDSKVFGTGSILGTTYGTPRDSRVNSITVRQLLSHTSGLWTNDANDPTFQNTSWSQQKMISWYLQNRNLQSTPGSKYAYSNFGYMMLGRVIEKVTGESYATWVNTNVLMPSGITSMQLAKNTLAGRAVNETIYYSQYGNPYGFPIERMDAQGGWIASATDLARFVVRADGFDTPMDLLSSANMTLMTTASSQSLAARDNYGLGWTLNNGRWLHLGKTAGTASALVRQPNGFNWAVIANADSSQNNSMLNIFDQLPIAIQAVTTWPNCDLF